MSDNKENSASNYPILFELYRPLVDLRTYSIKNYRIITLTTNDIVMPVYIYESKIWTERGLARIYFFKEDEEFTLSAGPGSNWSWYFGNNIISK